MLKKIPSLDGVRGFAALMVIFFHYFIAVNPSTQLLALLNKIAVFGQTGVSLFFVLSGFLITRILLNSKEDSNYFKNFYARRSLRIFPLYFLFLILYFYFLPFLIDQNINASSWFYWVYLQNIAMTFNWVNNGPFHFWSLAVEEHFYMFWPFIVYFFDINKILFSGLFLIVISFVLRFYLTDANYETFYFTFTRMDDLVLGTFLAILEKKNLLGFRSKKLFAKTLIFLFILNLVPWLFIDLISHFWLQIFKYPLIASFYFALIGYLLSDLGSKTSTFFKFSWLRFSGKISYGLYVYHPVVFLLGAKYFQHCNVFIDFSLLVFITFILSTLSFYIFENQFAKLKRHFE
jgi:peptidoglycan/LPS O-acetylase OafA/YrhL